MGRRSSRPAGELELFSHALDALAATVDRVGILGASFGAEAALSVVARDTTADVVIAIAPTTHLWPGLKPDGQVTSHWTWNGVALPFVPMTESWVTEDDPPAYREWYELSLDAAPDPAPARIPVENITGDVVLVAGGDDRVWPSAPWADEITERRAASGRSTTMLVQRNAGHRPILPGESVPPLRVGSGRRMNRGGTPAADAELGIDAWPHILNALTGMLTRPDERA